MSKILKVFTSLRRDAAIEAGKLTFAILGVGSTLANLGAMNPVLMGLAFVLVLCTWGVIYRMCE